MGLLDGGLQGIFGNVFGPLLLDGTLHKMTQIRIEDGSITESFADYSVRAMEVIVSAVVRANAGVPDTDIRFLILQLNVGATVEPGDQLTFRSKRWTLRAPIDQDPAQASWGAWGSPT